MPARKNVRILALVAVATVVTALAIVLAVLAVRERAARPPGLDVSIAIAVQDDVFPALVYIAHDQGFFLDEGVNVNLRSFPSARMALRAALAGETQMATTTGVPIAWRTLHGNEVAMLCTLGFTDRAFRVVGRSDRGIERPSDLVGKTIATQEASAEHLFLTVFLAFHEIDEDQVRLVYMPAVDLADALVDGEIDAFAMRQPFVGQALAGLKDGAVVFHGPDLYRSYFALVSTPGAFVDDKKATAVLRALVRAERLVRERPYASKDAVVRQLGETRRAEVETVWTEYHFELSAAQSFLLNLESEARWLMTRYPRLRGPLPNYLDMFHTEPLLWVRPESVTVWK